MQGFNLHVVTRAFLATDVAAARFDVLTAEMVQWYSAGVYPESKDIISAIVRSGRTEGTAKVYASRMLAWARAGKTPKSMSEMVKDGPRAGSKAGRPKGATSGAQTEGAQTPGDKATAAREAAADPVVILQGLMALTTKLVSASDADEFRDHIASAMAIIKRQRKA